jgi:hypothetical protein
MGSVNIVIVRDMDVCQGPVQATQSLLCLRMAAAVVSTFISYHADLPSRDDSRKPPSGQKYYLQVSMNLGLTHDSAIERLLYSVQEFSAKRDLKTFLLPNQYDPLPKL